MNNTKYKRIVLDLKPWGVGFCGYFTLDEILTCNVSSVVYMIQRGPTIIYVGSTKRPIYKRLSEHVRNKPQISQSRSSCKIWLFRVDKLNDLCFVERKIARQFKGLISNRHPSGIN